MKALEQQLDERYGEYVLKKAMKSAEKRKEEKDAFLSPKNDTYGDDKRSLQRLKTNLIKVIPAGTHEMETLLKISTVRWSTAVKTCAITCENAPQLLFNREFVNTYCSDDYALMMLILHELYHILFGHNFLFGEVDDIHNIAFDAVINARLCNLFGDVFHSTPDPHCTCLFSNLYSNDVFPEILLRPKYSHCSPGYGFEDVILAQQIGPENTQRVTALRDKLYKEPDSVSYVDVARLIQDISGESSTLLLGNHAGKCSNNKKERNNDDALAQLLGEAARKLLTSMGCSPAGEYITYEKPICKDPRKAFLRELRNVLVKASIFRKGGNYYKRMLTDSLRDAVTMTPQWRDRTLYAKEALLGALPVLYTQRLPTRHIGQVLGGVAHVYLDVSGSMCDDLPWIVGALRPLENAGLCKLFAFSTAVVPIPRGHIGKEALPTTCCTDVISVLAHIYKMPKAIRPRNAVILTDGWFCDPRDEFSREIDQMKQEGLKIFGAITSNGDTECMASFADSVTRLPAYEVE